MKWTFEIFSRLLKRKGFVIASCSAAILLGVLAFLKFRTPGSPADSVQIGNGKQASGVPQLVGEQKSSAKFPSWEPFDYSYSPVTPGTFKLAYDQQQREAAALADAAAQRAASNLAAQQEELLEAQRAAERRARFNPFNRSVYVPNQRSGGAGNAAVNRFRAQAAGNLAAQGINIP